MNAKLEPDPTVGHTLTEGLIFSNGVKIFVSNGPHDPLFRLVLADLVFHLSPLRLCTTKPRLGLLFATETPRWTSDVSPESIKGFYERRIEPRAPNFPPSLRDPLLGDSAEKAKK